MVTNTKMTPKSCGCATCRMVKRGTGGHFVMRTHQRAHRHAGKQQMRKVFDLDANLLPAAPHTVRIG